MRDEGGSGGHSGASKSSSNSDFAEYLCLSHNPFVDVIAVGMDNGHIKLYDEKTMQVDKKLKNTY